MMPFPVHHVRNPLWEEGNGQPESVPYDHPSLGVVGPSQPDPGSSFGAAQPRGVPSTGMPPSSGALSSPTHMPINHTFNQIHENVSDPSLGSPSAGSPADGPVGSVPNTGTPSNAGMPGDTDPPLDLLNLQQYQKNLTGDPNLPGVVAHHGVGAGLPSWDATLTLVRALKRENGTHNRGHIKSFEDHERFKLALKHLTKRRNEGHFMDMPQDQDGLQQLAGRLCDAIMNLEGIESGSTRNQHKRNGEKRVLDSVGVKCVKDMGPLQLEMLAWDFMVSLPVTRSYIQP